MAQTEREGNPLNTQVKNAFAGLVLSFCVAVTAMWIHLLPFWPFTVNTVGSHPVESLLIAILIGMLIGNVGQFSKAFIEGLNVVIARALPVAIILLGARLDFASLLAISAKALLINILCVVIAFCFTLWLCRRLGVERKLAVLLGVGTAICGSTAIIAITPIIKARKSHTTIAVATITLFGLLAIFIFPIIGHALDLSDMVFGVWAGTAIQAVPQVLAAGFAYGQKAGDIGTVVKLVRVLLLAPTIFLVSFWRITWKRRETPSGPYKTPWTTYFPPFIIGFILVVIFNSLGWLPTFNLSGLEVNVAKVFSELSSFLIVTVLAAIGLTTNVKKLAHSGVLPLIVGFASACILAAMSLGLIRYFI